MIYKFSYEIDGKYKYKVCTDEKEAILFFNLLIYFKCERISVLTLTPRHNKFI